MAYGKIPGCDCGADADGKYADMHSPGCALMRDPPIGAGFESIDRLLEPAHTFWGTFGPEKSFEWKLLLDAKPTTRDLEEIRQQIDALFVAHFKNQK